MKRRSFLLGSAAIAGTACLARASQGAATSIAHDLTIQPASYQFGAEPTQDLVSLSPDAPPPVIYGRQGVPLRLAVKNTLHDYTAMHWHGMRIENQMDGVPYLTQLPIGQDETFVYEFTPPDAGTYWYHPHCMTMSQMAHGLTGALIIEEANDPEFDADQVVNLRDFRINDDGSLLPSYTARGAARAGTFGNVQTANWQHSPSYDHPCGGLIRLRVLNTDTTRIYKLHLDTTDARIVAWDGHPVNIDLKLPSPDDPMLLGPGQRVDFAIKMPTREGQFVSLLAKFPGAPARAMTQLRSVGVDLKRDLHDLPALPQNPLAIPDLGAAQIHEFIFGWSPEGTAPNDGYCGSLGYTFWSINRTPWLGDAVEGTGPLATLDYGRSYILRLRNESPNLHPIHLHGLAFVPLRSNLRNLPPLFTDTLLLLKDEVVDIALVADNPGDWAFHCHVIEHQKTGLAGYIRVA
ncbi:Copper resistance protein A precursor [Roseovarius albus]|uniref:Copper resistance protein A n=1 Tax=Roseovarius albus TaxID=1247867 RepID=A0A1X6YIR9_9RHOB|nr:multicopper oxidase family protein [Roseovarius albus]SLN22889.1 Copper resistance protein A precursor [Roseovarius albus]